MHHTSWFTSMRNFPRWSGFKDFDSVTNIDYSDGQTFLDILKVSDWLVDCTLAQWKNQCCLPCLVPILPANTLHSEFATVIGLNCHSDKQLDELRMVINSYEKSCDVCSFWFFWFGCLIYLGCFMPFWQKFRFFEAAFYITYRRWYPPQREDGKHDHKTRWGLSARSGASISPD